jgi:hypothetical protein
MLDACQLAKLASMRFPSVWSAAICWLATRLCGMQDCSSACFLACRLGLARRSESTGASRWCRTR